MMGVFQLLITAQGSAQCVSRHLSAWPASEGFICSMEHVTVAALPGISSMRLFRSASPVLMIATHVIPMVDAFHVVLKISGSSTV